MTKLKHLWREYATAILLVMSLIAGFIWGRATAPVYPDDTPKGGSVEGRGPEPVEGEPPAAEFIDLPGSNLESELVEPPPGHTPPADPRLSIRVDVRDALSDQPARADVWLTTIVGEDSHDELIREQTSLVEFELPGADEADAVYIKVQAPGYRLWSIGVRHQVQYDRLLPLDVKLEPLDGGAG